MWNEMKKGFRDLDRERVLGMMGMEQRRTTAERVVPFFALFGAGVLVGVGVGLMFAPRAGRELRNDLKEKLEEGVPRAAEVIQSAVDSARASIPQPSASAPHS
jgi:hypothetical protein